MKILKTFIFGALLFSDSFLFAQQDDLCRLSALVRGNSHYFWYWGRNAWEGPGQLSCNGGLTLRPVFLRWNSWEVGNGLSYDDLMQVEISNISKAQIDELFGVFRTYRPTEIKLTKMDNDLRLIAVLDHVQWTLSITPLEGDSTTRSHHQMNYGLLSILPLEAEP